MRANKAKNTKPEITLRKAMFAAGIRGYRLHWKKAVGRPDISFPGLKLAVFVFGTVVKCVSFQFRSQIPIFGFGNLS